MNIRDALIQQAPSLELQRAAQAELARLAAELRRLTAVEQERDGLAVELADCKAALAAYSPAKALTEALAQSRAHARRMKVEREHALEQLRALRKRLRGTARQVAGEYVDAAEMRASTADPAAAQPARAAGLTSIGGVTITREMAERAFADMQGRDAAAHAERMSKAQPGACPKCYGEGELGGQFCGGYHPCDACGGSGKEGSAVQLPLSPEALADICEAWLQSDTGLITSNIVDAFEAGYRACAAAGQQVAQPPAAALVPANPWPDAALQQHARDSAELRRLCAERDKLRAEVKELRAAAARAPKSAVSHQRIREVFQMYGTGRLDGFSAAVRAIEAASQEVGERDAKHTQSVSDVRKSPDDHT